MDNSFHDCIFNFFIKFEVNQASEFRKTISFQVNYSSVSQAENKITFKVSCRQPNKAAKCLTRKCLFKNFIFQKGTIFNYTNKNEEQVKLCN